jgi:hypothetical protein
MSDNDLHAHLMQASPQYAAAAAKPGFHFNRARVLAILGQGQ